MDKLPISESRIRQQATAESFRRGQSYAGEGAVLSLVLRGNELQAEVAGSQFEPYVVNVTFGDQDVAQARCSCPYSWGGWCKHIVAVLLMCLDEPDQIEERPRLDEILTGLDEAQLRELVLDLASHNPRLVEWIEARLSPPSNTLAHVASHAPVNARWIRDQVHGVLHSLDRMNPSEAYWHVGSVVQQVYDILDDVWQRLEVEDGRGALQVIETVTDAFVGDCWHLDDSDGHIGDFFYTLGEAWTEVALTADLTKAERQTWAERLTAWQSEIGDYGIDDAFDAAQAAFLAGWDNPRLQRVLQGEAVDSNVWGDVQPWFADELTAARLRVLDRQGRHDAYLNLARAEGQDRAYVLMLVRLGRVEDALKEGMERLQRPYMCLDAAKALYQRGDVDAALQMAEHGLSDTPREPSDFALLAEWTSQVAQEARRFELALSAAVIAFEGNPNLDSYRRLAALAGDRWAELRCELLERLSHRTAGMLPSGAVDVLLSEGLLDVAIAAAETGRYSYEVMEKVVDAAIETHPDWAATTALHQAARIIEPGDSGHYDYAITWLRRARDAYRAAGRESDWQAYLVDLRARHGRKYKLMGLLDALIART